MKKYIIVLLLISNINYLYANTSCTDYFYNLSDKSESIANSALAGGIATGLTTGLSTRNKSGGIAMFSMVAVGLGVAINFWIKGKKLDQVLTLLDEAHMGTGKTLIKAHKQYVKKYGDISLKKFAAAIHAADISGEGCNLDLKKPKIKRSIFLKNVNLKLTNEEMLKTINQLNSQSAKTGHTIDPIKLSDLTEEDMQVETEKPIKSVDKKQNSIKQPNTNVQLDNVVK